MSSQNWISKAALDARTGHEQMDRAYINFEPEFISLKNSKCYDCIPFGLSTRSREDYFVYKTDHQITLKSYSNSDFESKICEWRGKLETNISYVFTETCEMENTLERTAENEYKPIWVAVLVLFVLFLVEALLVKIPFVKRIFEDEDIKEPKRKRILSLDTFRGLSLAFMIFVNFGGGEYWFFEHASWNGMTVADLLMAWFMFMAGVSLELSFNSRLRRGVQRTKIAYELYRRVARLWLLGVFLINGPEKLETMRFPGVLQRFAWAFLIHGTVMLAVYKSPATRKVEKGERFYAFQDLIGNRAYVIHWIVMGLLTAIFVFITFLLKVPGCPTGYLGPAGLQNAPEGDERRWADGKVFIVGQNVFSDLPLMLENTDSEDENQYSCAGGSAAYIDSLIFGPNHIYTSPTPGEIFYDDNVFPDDFEIFHDPEGWLGMLGSTLIVFFGICCCRIHVHYKCNKEKLSRWMLWSFVLLAITAAFNGVSENGGLIPINKNLWSVTFVTVMSGFAFCMLSVLYLIQDVYELWQGRPFIYLGMNSMFVYLAHEVLAGYWPFNSYVVADQGHAWVLGYNIAAVFLLTVLAGYSKWVGYQLIV